ncbi:Curli production assembly/transport component CsgG [uncultured Winogradskyella sp.]|uniref:Curli production assembly/transport component CsgG n=1 Tax=uncultured Winogradskyella sp. TaxID=395353 RepID=UPI00261D8FD8|nr:Curli production assembly/transport component CsgG [uncultured Winogradskyella sp.]
MTPKFSAILLSIAMTVVCVSFASSQEIEKTIEAQKAQVREKKNEKSINRRFAFFSYRGSNAIDMAAGSAIINGDYSDPEFEVYFRIGYKHHLTSHLNFNITYNKYNIAFKELYNNGFMSFDLNLELLFSPYTRFSPFLYAGVGYNADNDFTATESKAQGGFGFEVIITDRVGLKLFGEYNYFLSDELDGLIAGDSDDVLYRMGLGLNIYFGGNKKKEALRKKMKTVINSNPIPILINNKTQTYTDNKTQSLFLQDQ